LRELSGTVDDETRIGMILAANGKTRTDEFLRFELIDHALPHLALVGE
jgi:hypothetical protein